MREQVVVEESNSRRHHRVPSRLRCWCEGENVTVYARIGNLSEGGLFLRTSTPLPLGTRAIVRLKEGELEEVSAPVTVVWTRETAGAEPAGMGLQFGPVEEKVKQTLRRMVQAAVEAAGQ